MFGLLVGLATGFAGVAITGMQSAFSWFFTLGSTLVNIFTKPKVEKPPALEEFRAHRSAYSVPMIVPFGKPQHGDNVMWIAAVRKEPIIARQRGTKLFGLIEIGGRKSVVGWRYFADWGTSVGYADREGATAIDRVIINDEIYFDISDEATQEFKDLSLTRLKANGGTLTFHLGGDSQTVSDVHANKQGNVAPAYMDDIWIEFTNHEIFGQIPKVEARIVKTGLVEGSTWRFSIPANFENRFSHCTAVVRDVLYVAGGLNAGGRPNTFWSYSVRDGWKTLAPMPYGRDSATLTPFYAASGKVTLILSGGVDNSNNDIIGFYEYDIEANSWTQIPDPPIPDPFPMSGHAMEWFEHDTYGTGLFFSDVSTDPGVKTCALWVSGNKLADRNKVIDDIGMGARTDMLIKNYKGHLYIGGGAYFGGGSPTSPSRNIYRLGQSDPAFVQIPVTLDGVSYAGGRFPDEIESPASGIPDQGLWGVTIWGGQLCIFGRNSNGEIRIYISEDGVAFRDISQTFAPVLGNYGETSGGATAYSTFDSVSQRIQVIGGADKASSAPTNHVWTSQPPTVYGDTYRLGGIFDWVCRECGISPDEIDTDELIDEVLAFSINQIGEGTSVIAPLQLGFFVDVRQNVWLEFIKRGPQWRPIYTGIQESDLGAHEEGKTNVESMGQELVRAQDMPFEIKVRYFDLAKNQEINVQPYAWEGLKTQRSDILDLPIVLTANDATRIAAITLDNLWAERLPTEYSLFPKFSLLPGDYVTIPYQNGTYTMRILAVPMGANDLVQVSAVSDDPQLYVGQYVGDSGQAEDPGGTLVDYEVRGVLINLPALIESHIDENLAYMAATVLGPDRQEFAGAEFYISRDEGTTYNFNGLVETAAVIGTCDTILGGGIDSYAIDRGTFRVTLENGTLESKTVFELFDGANFAYVGNLEGTGELINFANATLVSGSTFDIDTMFRGRKGTEFNVDNHVAGETFVLLDTAVQEMGLRADDINAALKYKSILLGSTDPQPLLDAATAHDFNYLQWTHKPFPVSYIRGDKLPDGVGWFIEWSGLTRSNPNWLLGLELARSEPQPAYRLVFFDPTFTTELASYFVSMPTNSWRSRARFDLSEALQIHIFGAAQETLYIQLQARNDNYKLDDSFSVLKQATITN